MEGTYQAAAPTAQAPSVMPTADVQTSASQYGTAGPSASQVSQTMAPPQQQAWAPQMPQAPAPQASAQAPSQGNPWQQAFQALSASLNTPNPSLTQAQSSVYQTTPTPQASIQAQWASPQAHQIYAPQASTQAYAPTQAPAYAPQQAPTYQPQGQSASATDSYLSQISDTSLEVLEHFGAEAPALRNQYSCAVEDALIEQVQRGNSLNTMLSAAGEERAAMNIMLTDPDVLADYVNDFYGPQGPYPTETAEEATASQQAAYRAQFEAEIEAQARNDVPPNFQRPQMEMPERGRSAQSQAGNFWGDFSQLMDQNPENAWQYLAQAPQGALQGKMLIQDI